MAKHHSKEELERDPLIDFLNKASDYYRANKTAILSVGTTFILVIAILISYSVYSGKQEEKAQILLSQAEAAYSVSDYNTALYGDDRTFALGFTEIADEYSRTNAGNLAIYYAAVSNFKLDKFEDALAYINRYKHVKGILGVGSISFEASLYELNGQYDKAAITYEKAAKWDENYSTTPYNLYKAANAHYLDGKYDKAENIIATIIREYPDSEEFTESKKLLGLLAAS